MPHQRCYSWPPHGVSTSLASVQFVSRTQTVTRKATKFLSPLSSTFDRPYAPDFSPYSSSDEEDSAGIVSSKGEEYYQRRRQRRRERVQKLVAGDDDVQNPPENNYDLVPPEDLIVSSVTEASETPSAILRRFFWPYLETMRRLLAPIQFWRFLMRPWSPQPKSVGTDGKKSHENNTIESSSPRPPSLSLTAAPTDDGGSEQTTTEIDSDWTLPPVRRHRRCHSEQPRAWREPSPGLWTLAEE